MSVQYPKKDRGGVSASAPELVHILRDPPKSYYTKKKETVNIADVMYMIRPDQEGSDPSRINENINYVARGINPMVEVSYSNMGGGSTNTSLHNGQATNPYKIEVVRPPLMPVETLVPLSAPRIHQNYSINTNHTVAPRIIDGNYDAQVAKNITNVRKHQDPLRPNLGYNIQKVQNDFYPTANPNMIHQDKLNYALVSSATQMGGNTLLSEMLNKQLNDPNNFAVTSTFSTPTTFQSSENQVDLSKMNNVMKQNYTVNSGVALPSLDQENVRNVDVRKIQAQRTLLKTLGSGYHVIVHDPKTNTFQNITASLKERNNIAVSAAVGLPIVVARNDGKQYNIKDYNWKVIQTNAGTPAIVVEIQNREVVLDRNQPLYAMTTNVSQQGGKTLDIETTYVANNEVSIAGILGNSAVSDSKSGYDEGLARMIQNKIELNDKIASFGSFEDRVARPVMPVEWQVPKQNMIKTESVQKEAHQLMGGGTRFANRHF